MNIKFLLTLALVITPLVFAPNTVFQVNAAKTVVFFILVDFALLLTVFRRSFLRGKILEIIREPISVLLLLFLFINMIAALTGLNPIRSFFGTPGRMTGILMLIHFILFYLLLRVNFSDKKDYIKFARASVFTALLVAFIAFLQILFPGKILNLTMLYSPVSTIGNEGFLAQYILVHFFLAWWLKNQDDTSKSLRLAYTGMQIFFAAMMLLSGRRGILVGFVIGAAVIGFSHLGKKINWRKYFNRKYLLGGLLAVVCVISVWIYVENFSRVNIIENNLKHITDFSFNSPTFQTRWMLLKISLKGFFENPFFGVGPENFEMIFNKHYMPAFMKYGVSETFFDRAHNVVLQVLTETGIFGALILIAFAVVLLVKARREKVLLALLLAFFVTSLFEVENIIPLIHFFFIAALVSFLAVERQHKKEIAYASSPDVFCRFLSKTVCSVFVMLSICYHLLFFGGLWLMGNATIRFLNVNWQPNEFQEEFDAGYAMAYFSPVLRAEASNSAITAFIANSYKRGNMEIRLSFLQNLADKMRGAIKKFPYEVRYFYTLGRLYKEWARGDPVYYAQASEISRKGLDLSPNKQNLYFTLGEVLIQKGGSREDIQEGLAILKKAVSLEPEAGLPHWVLGNAYVSIGRQEEGLSEIEKSVELGVSISNFQNIVNMADQLYEGKKYNAAIKLYKLALTVQPNNMELQAKLAEAEGKIPKE